MTRTVLEPIDLLGTVFGKSHELRAWRFLGLLAQLSVDRRLDVPLVR